MPERDGIESAECIRQFEKSKHKRNVPIIGMSGHESEMVKQQCLKAGMNIVWAKPISRQDVIDVLKKLNL